MGHYPSMHPLIKSWNGDTLPRDPDRQNRERYSRNDRYAHAIESSEYRSTSRDFGGVVFYCSTLVRSLPYSDRILLGISTEMAKVIHAPPPSAPARTSVGKCIPR